MRTDRSAPYPDVSPRADFPGIEHRILDRWSQDDTFAQSVEDRSDREQFVFYDGPPFANGLPHHGHLLTGFVKDVVPRYWTMKGYQVPRRFGWDCHGLPVEIETEKQLGVSGRVNILDFGIDKFNDACRSSVMRYTAEWEDTVRRQARWVDFENDYRTMDIDYMESVMWAFKTLYDKGLIYEAYRVMPYSWAAETPLSNFEIRLDDSTRPRQDPAVTVGFDLEAAEGDPGSLRALAWTTTPWTLPSNLALGLGPDISYVAVPAPDDADVDFFVLAEAAVDRYATELGEDVEPVVTWTGSELAERRYRPLFPYFEDRSDAFRCLAVDFVETGDGTGIVHMAPAFGEDDQRACEAAGIPIGSAIPVDDHGAFTEAVPEWSGLNVFLANPEIIRHLKDQGRVLRHETYDHNYPHCWRTDEPIIYKAISSWYVKVAENRDRLGQLNQKINWVPHHVRDGRFGRWLEGARDWSISRNRFWGAPIPVWVSDDPDFPRVDVYGSLDELEADFGVRPDDLHRPTIDNLTRPNPDDPSGKATMRRVPEVLDCWFESGSMPFAQVHYPFENQEWFESHFPADFIVEYINQTRGWFYTLHVLAGLLFDRPAFENVICHGILLAEDGTKLSKKLRNYTEPEEIFETQGADALRWYLMASPILRGGDARINDQGIDDVTRQVMLPIWNAYSFFTLYANASGYRAQVRHDSDHLLDRYILAKTRDLVTGVDDALSSYDLSGATAEVSAFLGALTNWYIRRSRERFWGVDEAGNATEPDTDALDTLYTVLRNLVQAAAPLLPMLSEEIWSGLRDQDDPVSVHLCHWPDAELLAADPKLVVAMDRVRDAVSAGLSLREQRNLRVRLPLTSATFAGAGAADIEPYADLLADELNVKAVDFSDDVASYGVFRLRPHGKVLGPKLGPEVQTVIKAAKSGDWTDNGDGTVTVGGHRLEADEFDLALDPADGIAAAALDGNDAVIVLDTELTPALEAEGKARDLVRRIQQARKDAELAVTDRITVEVGATPADAQELATHLDYIAAQVLATELRFNTEASDTIALSVVPGR